MADYNPYEPPRAPASDVALPSGGPATLATLGSRFAASMIDTLLQLAVILPLELWMGLFTNFPKATSRTTTQLLLLGAASLGSYVVLNGYLLARNGQTIGKRLLKIRTVRIEDGQPASLGRLVFTRYLPLLVVAQIPGVGAFLSLIDVCFIFRANRRCLHDYVARTRVTQTA